MADSAGCKMFENIFGNFDFRPDGFRLDRSVSAIHNGVPHMCTYEKAKIT